MLFLSEYVSVQLLRKFLRVRNCSFSMEFNRVPTRAQYDRDKSGGLTRTCDSRQNFRSCRSPPLSQRYVLLVWVLDLSGIRIVNPHKVFIFLSCILSVSHLERKVAEGRV